MELFTLVLPSGKDGNEIMVMTDIVVVGDEAHPCFRDISYAQPMYLCLADLKNLFPTLNLYNLWSIDDIESTITHCD